MDFSALFSVASSLSMPAAYIVGGVVLGHYVPKAWTAVSTVGSQAAAVYQVGKLVVAAHAQAAAPPPTPAAIVLPPNIAAAAAAATPPAA
jgi:hypothetical protein